MTQPEALTRALTQGRLLVLWGTSEPPLGLTRALTGLPPLPILSLDPSQALEDAFAAAGVPLRVLRSRADVPAAGRHNLLKLAGDLPTRSGLVRNRAAIRDLRSDPAKQHLLDEARRIVGGGAGLLLACDFSDYKFLTWWTNLLPTFCDVALFAVGDPAASWSPSTTCLGPDPSPVAGALRAAWADAQRDAEAQLRAAAEDEGGAQAPPGNVTIIHTGGGAYIAEGAHVEVEGGDFVGRDSVAGDAGGRDRPAPDEPLPADTAGYNLAAVRDLLLAAFTAADLRRLFLYTSHIGLHALTREFGPNDGLAAMVDKTIPFCHTRRLLPDLLREVERANPCQYAHFAGRLGTT